jgi:hypothetical protein
VSLTGDVKQAHNVGHVQGKTVIIATGAMGRKATIGAKRSFWARGELLASATPRSSREPRSAFWEILKKRRRKQGLARFAATVYLISPTEGSRLKAIIPPSPLPNLKVLYGKTVTAIEAEKL